MCTLTYIPHQGGFSLTHNRDERSNRPSAPDIQRTTSGENNPVYFPQDLEAGGTWFAVSKKRAACVLNGGSHSYTPQPPYRHSRGLLPLRCMDFPNAQEFYENYSFSQLEPFSLLVVDDLGVSMIRHDEEGDSITALDPDKAHIWSSRQLYALEVRQKRQRWFQRWRTQEPLPTADEIRRWHLETGDGDSENDLRMSRWGILKTVSLTQFTTHASGEQKLYYKSLVESFEDELSYSLD